MSRRDVQHQHATPGNDRPCRPGLRILVSAARCCWILIITGMLTLPGRAGATQASQGAFSAANRLYEQGKFGEAVQAYQALLSTGVNSANLHFNLGNAAFQNGHPGRAVAHWEQARRLAPRDPDVTANLGFVRRSGAVPEQAGERTWERAIHQLTLNEWAGLALAGMWLWTGLLAASRRSDALRLALAPYRPAAAAWTLAACIALGAAAWSQLGRPLGVVVDREVTARYSPLQDSTAAFRLPEGSEVRVLNHHGDWTMVTAPGQPRTAWLPSASLVVVR